MRRLIPFLALAALSTTVAVAQTWEKLVAPGLSYRMEFDARTPRVIHALRWSMGAPSVFGRSEMAQMRIFAGSGAEAREEVSSLVNRTGAIAGLNGDFFPTSGEPLGAMVRDGQLLSRPFPGRAAFGWGPGTSAFGNLEWSGTATVDGLDPLPLNGLNEDVAPDRLVLFTEAAAEARAPLPNVYLVVRMETVGFTPTGTTRGVLAEVVRNQPSLRVPPGHSILVMGGNRASQLSRAIEAGNVQIRMQTSGMDWSRIDNVIGGGPSLLRGGQLNVDFETASFNRSFSETRHPRTAVGRTAEGDLWFVVIDGRQPMSAGASLVETANVLRALGCVDAINLDGGGSSTLSLFGQALNRPSDGRERRISNAILLFGPRFEGAPPEVAIQGPSSIPVGSLIPYRLIGGDGLEIPDREVLWTAMGPGGWVDQSGTLRTLVAGPVVVTAMARGARATLTVNVTGAPTPTPNSTPPTPR